MNFAVLFDLDGTLLDTVHDFIITMDMLRKEYQYPPLNEKEKALLRIAVTHGMREMLAIGFADLNADFLHQKFLDYYQSIIANHTIYFPGIEELLYTLDDKKIPWGIVTNKPSRQTESLLINLNLKHRAKVVVSGDTTPYAKPHPAPLLYAAEYLNIPPNQCLFIGDHERDIIAGKSAGMATLAVLFGYIEDLEKAQQEWQADHYVTQADEILPWILSQWIPSINTKK